jgi:hypothetical protein
MMVPFFANECPEKKPPTGGFHQSLPHPLQRPEESDIAFAVGVYGE